MKFQHGRWIAHIGIAGCTALAGCRSPETSAFLPHRPTTSVLARMDDEQSSVRERGTESAISQSIGTSSSRATSMAGRPVESKPVLAVAWEEPADLALQRTDEDGTGSPDAVLSLDELQQLAIAGNPTLRQAQGLLQQAQGNWLQSGLYPNPVVGYDGGGNNGPFDQQGAYISQSIVTGNKLKLNRAVASHDVERARWDTEAQTLRVINEVRIRYIAALGAQRQVAVARELVDVADKGVRIAEQLLEGEQVSRADVLQARLHHNQTQILLRNAQFRAAAAWQQLGNVIGSPDLHVRPLEGRLELEDAAELNWDDVWQRLLAENPLLHAARARAAAAAVQIQREKAQVLPDLQLTGNIWNDSIRPPSTMYGLNVGVSLPVFNRNQGNICAAVGEYHVAQAEVARLELVLRDRLAEVFERYQAAGNQVRTYRESILPMAQENLALTLKTYEEGEFDFLRVLTARRDLFQAHIDNVSALTELRITGIEIEGLQLTGGLDPVQSNPAPSNQAGQTTGPGN
jgi:outer membrane protein, heavy metal efflux system